LNKHDTSQSRKATLIGIGICGAAVVSVQLATAGAALAKEATLSGESTTIVRTWENSDNKVPVPAYEYLRLSATDLGPKGELSFFLGGWGRVDLGEKSREDNPDGDLQYGYLSYRPGKNNLVVNLGRQFVTEGVAAEKLDGLYLRSDLRYGFGAAAFAGAPVVTEPNRKGGDLVYGGRLSHSVPGYYTVGVSGLQSYQGSGRYREEEGLDLWLHPLERLDLTGRSSYNSITEGWMEHDYRLSYRPTESLSITGRYSHLNYHDYFFRTTGNIFSFAGPAGAGGRLDPREQLDQSGGSISYTPVSAVTVTADYLNYRYDVAGGANYYGGKVNVGLSDSFVAGCGVHRMDGTSEALRYNEYRVFASKRWAKVDLTADFFDVYYDSPISGVRNTYSVVGAASYAIRSDLKAGADLTYSRSTDLDNAVSALVKLTYEFDTRLSGEGRSK